MFPALRLHGVLHHHREGLQDPDRDFGTGTGTQGPGSGSFTWRISGCTRSDGMSGRLGKRKSRVPVQQREAGLEFFREKSPENPDKISKQFPENFVNNKNN